VHHHNRRVMSAGLGARCTELRDETCKHSVHAGFNQQGRER
jgi:hypothetical protein